ncbi:hypothetical protein CPLU01_09622 [Colletotrichum plurivorum]|uniref:Secreted protein n=1 Tax=Colletotrichum plurivorum TaxID=2175906 RepID=A0A8H6NBJ0_9PEZI|nr:hypothetical protein CPLU01_09622 [Colletotrichum plurivorum]
MNGNPIVSVSTFFLLLVLADLGMKRRIGGTNGTDSHNIRSSLLRMTRAPARDAGSGRTTPIHAASRLTSTEASPGEEPQTAKNHKRCDCSVFIPRIYDVQIRFKTQVGDGERRWEADAGSLLSHLTSTELLRPQPSPKPI